MNNFYLTDNCSILTKIKILFSCLCFMLVATSFGQTKIFTTSGSFTVPCDVTSITVKVWGAGGAGGGSTSNGNSGAGGGAGGYSYRVVTVTAGEVINYTVGTGGTGSTGNGTAGTASIFPAASATLTANGGARGLGNSNSTSAGGTATGGSTNTSGGNGLAGGTSTGGNGGAAAGGGGAGGAGQTNNNGLSGVAPGGGGGGAERSSSNRSGGNGGDGQIELTYTSTLLTYCTPSYGVVQPISNVTFAGINNTTSAALGTPPSHEQFCATATVIQGSPTNAISIKGNTNAVNTNNIKVFIDWNQNGTFDVGTNEEYEIGGLYNSTGTDAVVLTGNIAVPATATLGNTMMRVVKNYLPAASNTPCYSGPYFGQAEDYVVNVLPCPTFSLTGTTGTTVCTNTGTSTVTLTGNAANLPVGTYTVTYSRSSPAQTGLTATMTVSTAGTGTFTASGLTTAGSSTITVTNLTLSFCSTVISANNAAASTVYQSADIVLTSGTQIATICPGTALTSTVYTYSGTATNPIVTGLPAGLSATINTSAKTITITGTPTANGTYTITVSGNTSPCPVGTISGAIIFDVPTPSATVTDATCSTSTNGAIILNGIDRTPLQFNKSEHDYIGLGSSFLNNLTNFTLEGWIKFNKADIISSQGLFGQNDSPEFYLTPSALEFHSTVLNSSTWTTSTPLTATLGNNTWHHVAATGDTSQVKIYIDGVLMVTQSIIMPAGHYGASGETTTIGGGTIYGIGGGSPGDAFQGQMRKIGMYNTTLNAASILALASTPNVLYTGVETGLLAGYNFIEGSGSTLSSVPAGKNGTFPSGTTAPQHTYSYSWTGPGGFSSSSKDISSLIPGTYSVTISSLGSTCTTTTSFIVGSTPNNSPGTASSSPNICFGSAIPTVTRTTSGATGIGVPTGLPTGVTASWSSNTITLTGTPSGTGTFNYSIPLTGGCGTIYATGTITVNPILTTPTVGTITQPDCKTATGSVVLTGLPSGSWTVNPGGFSGNTTTATITGLAVGTNNLTVTNSTGCTSPATGNIVINPAVINTWNGLAWSNVTVPTSLQAIIFDGNYNSSANVDGCRCEVKAGRTVVFNAPHTLKITHEVLVDPSGTLSFGSGASLVQINDTPSPSNSGKITYNRSSTTILRTDYVYWSAPVGGFTLGGIATGTLYYSLNAAANSWSAASASTTMAAGIGYIVRGGGTWFDTGTTSVSAPFFGAPNNGVVNTAIGGADTSNLIGNPYPSAIDADTFLSTNSTVIEGTLYFWTHNTAIQLASQIANGKAGSGRYAYTSDDYASYNLSGGTGTTAISGGTTPNGTIAAGQGFMAIGKTAGNAVFNNSMRLKSVTGTTLSNSTFFKMATTSKTGESSTTSILEKNRLWLNLTNEDGAFKQTLIGYITGATNKYDSAYDGISYSGNSFIDFYSVNENNLLSIQGRALPFQDTDSVPLGYSSTIPGEFTIAIDNADGSLSNQEVFLEDKLTLTTHNLKQSPYQFTTEIGTFNERFMITYKTQTIAGDDTFEETNNAVFITQKESEISIHSQSELINEVSLYDITGKLITHKSQVNNKEALLHNVPNSEQVLLITIKLNNGQIVNKKIIN